MLVTDPDPDAIDQCRQKTEATVNEKGTEAEYYYLPITDRRQLISFIRMIDIGLLVIGEGMNLLAETHRVLIYNIDYPVLMVR